MTTMQFDFSALDAELDRLGPTPEDAVALAQQFAASFASAPIPLEEVDRALAALESDGDFEIEAALSQWSESALLGPAAAPRAEPAASQAAPAAPEQSALAEPLQEEQHLEASLHGEPPHVAPPRDEPLHAEPLAAASEPPPSLPRSVAPAPLTQSQEIALPDPIPREELAGESGELRLDGDDPSSGSFELPDSPTMPRITARDTQAAPPSPMEPFDDVQDALDGSQPLLLSSSRPARTTFADRDPDAEFDALLSEATDPRGIPTGETSGEVDADDLLRGLEGDELADEEVSAADLADAEDEPHEAELLTRSLLEDTGDNTEVIDRKVLDSAHEHEDEAEVLSADELDSGELEIVMEDEDGATLAPPPGPQSSKAPPPPPPHGGGDKRPSLIGRIFNSNSPNKRDPE